MKSSIYWQIQFAMPFLHCSLVKSLWLLLAALKIIPTTAKGLPVNHETKTTWKSWRCHNLDIIEMIIPWGEHTRRFDPGRGRWVHKGFNLAEGGGVHTIGFIPAARGATLEDGIPPGIPPRIRSSSRPRHWVMKWGWEAVLMERIKHETSRLSVLLREKFRFQSRKLCKWRRPYARNAANNMGVDPML
jgi:hypothetical protein